MGFFSNIAKIFGAKDIQGPQSTAPPVQSSQPQRKILIVEDEKLLADALEAKFTHENFIVFKAENGQVGLEQAQANNPDIILLDLMMPIMDGKTMLHKLRGIPQFKTTRVVVLTNEGDVESIKETKFYDNASEFLIKSNVTPEDIVNVVKNLLH